MQEYIGIKIVSAEPQTRKVPTENPLIDRGFELGYKVVYEDGYVSWSPKEVFEKAYRRISGMTFGLALEEVKRGKKIARKGWNGKGIFIELQQPDENSKMTSPYIFIDTSGLQTTNPDAPKSRVPWIASQTDILAEDWVTVG